VLAANLDRDSAFAALVRDAHNALICFATCEWAALVPWLMIDTELCEMVGSLPEGTTLAEAIPEAFGASAPSADVAASPSAPPVVIAPPPVLLAISTRVPTLSVDISSRPRGQARVLVPPSHTSSRSPATASPVQMTPSPVVPPVSLRPPSAGSGADAVLPPTPGSAPSPSVAVPPVGTSRAVGACPLVPAAPDVGRPVRVCSSFSSCLCFVHVRFLVCVL
jgi:hypothetical protein